MNSGDSAAIDERVADVIEDFEFLDAWEDRYRYLIEMGDKLPPFPDEQKVEENRVQGCTSNVWMVEKIDGEGAAARLHLQADSDARIVRGLVALLLLVYDDQPVAAAGDYPVEDLFERLGLEKHLSRSRANGLRSMVRRIRDATQV